MLWNIIQVPTVSEMVSHYTWERRMEKCFDFGGKGAKKCNKQIFDKYHGNNKWKRKNTAIMQIIRKTKKGYKTDNYIKVD